MDCSNEKLGLPVETSNEQEFTMQPDYDYLYGMDLSGPCSVRSNHVPVPLIDLTNDNLGIRPNDDDFGILSVENEGKSIIRPLHCGIDNTQLGLNNGTRNIFDNQHLDLGLPKKHKLPYFNAQMSPPKMARLHRPTDIYTPYHSGFPAPDYQVFDNTDLNANYTRPNVHQHDEQFVHLGLLKNHTVTSLTDCGSQSVEFSDIPSTASTLINVPNTDFNSNKLQNEPRPIHKTDNMVGEQSVENDQFNFLLQIFPDADPSFLKAKSKLGNIDLDNFITEALEKKEYPKVQFKVENVTSEKTDIKLFTTEFKIEDFLKVFSDPFNYFLEENRVCQRSEHGCEFLKNRYKFISMKVINQKYIDCRFNLTKTCQVLDREPNSRTGKRGKAEIRMPITIDLPFLKESCFINHKDEIKGYIDRLAAEKQQVYEQAEKNRELIECGCCYQMVLFEECGACNEGDLFCKTCIQKSAEVRIGDGHTTFPCLQDCGSHFSLEFLQTLLDTKTISKVSKRIQQNEVEAAGIEGLEGCPFCEYATIPPPDTKIFTCLNPECSKESCRNCHKESHIPLRCEELENDEQAKARKYIEDEMTKALVRECYKCKKNFIKTDGCNKMTCTCGARMCYICRKPVTNYTHFNGPNGSEDQKCPLYSSEKVLHVDAVNAVAVKALQTVTTTNPELKLKHDPTKVLPSASTASTNVPPGVDENVNRLLARLQAMNNALDLPNEEHQQGGLINLENGHYANEENGPDALIRQILEDNRPDAEMHQMIEQMNPGPFNQNFLVGLRNFHEMGHDRH